MKDIAAVRAAIPRFAETPPAEVRAALNGLQRVPLGTFELREAKRLSRMCERKGLSVGLTAIDSSGLLPYHEGRKTGLIIEDSSFATAICEAAIARGLRVLQIEA